MFQKLPEKLLDAKILDAYRTFQTPEDPNFLTTYLTAVLNTIPNYLEGIRLAISHQDSAKLARDAHALKSSCSNVGAIPILELCTQLESLAREGSFGGMQEHYVKLTKLLELLKHEIHSLPEFKQST